MSISHGGRLCRSDKALPFTSWVIFGKLFNQTVSQFFICKIANISNGLIEL